MEFAGECNELFDSADYSGINPAIGLFYDVAGEPAGLGLLWTREGGSWKISSYVVLTH